MDFFAKNIIPGEVIVQLLAFLIVFFTLRRFAWNPILKTLAARRERIEHDFARIEAAQRDIERLKSDYSTRLQKIEDEARAKIQEAIEAGTKVGREIQDKARQDAQAAFDKAKENLQLEAAKTRIELRREIASLTLQVTEKILQEKLNDTKQQDRIASMIDELESAIQKKGSRS